MRDVLSAIQIPSCGRRFLALSAVGFLAAGLLLYWRALTIPFVSDDWEFLLLVDTARSVAVCFDLLVGRFVRPLVMLTYYTGYSLFGLWPLPYHVASVLVHTASAWLLCLVAIRLDRAHRRWIGVLSGLLFLAFAGHTEAVTWVAGLADPFVAMCLFAMLLAADRTLDSASSWRWTAAVWILSAAALLGKESAVVLPAILAAYGFARGASPRRVIRLAAVPAVVVVGYWIARALTTGMPTGAYAGLGGYGGMLSAQARALLIRAFLPPSNRVARAWQAGRDTPFVVLAMVFIAGITLGKSANRRAVGFAAVAMAIALAPALPLSIALATTESERMVYIPTAFAAIVTVFTTDALFARRAVSGVLVGLLIAAHAVWLQRMHAHWRAAGETFDGVMQSFLTEARAHDPGRDGLIVVLNLPDSVRGAYVLRRGFYARLHFSAPDLEARAPSIIGVVSQTLLQPSDPSPVRRLSPQEFSLDVTPNMFLNLVPPVRPFYTFPSWTRSNFVLEFTPAVGRAAVFQVSAGRTSFLGDVTGPGAPFGMIDIPADGATCDRTLRFSGWALDDTLVTRIVAARDATPGDPIGSEDVAIGAGTWATGTRPDVAAVYQGFPHTDRAEWNVTMDCAVLAPLPDHRARIRIRAFDEAGHSTEIGARTIAAGTVK